MREHPDNDDLQHMGGTMALRAIMYDTGAPTDDAQSHLHMVAVFIATIEGPSRFPDVVLCLALVYVLPYPSCTSSQT